MLNYQQKKNLFEPHAESNKREINKWQLTVKQPEPKLQEGPSNIAICRTLEGCWLKMASNVFIGGILLDPRPKKQGMFLLYGRF